MAFKDLKRMIAYSDGGITSKIVAKGEKSQVTLFSMAAGTDIGDHTSTKEGQVYVIEGEGVFTLEGVGIAMDPGVLITFEKNAKHSLSAKKNTSFLLFLSG